MFRQLSLTVLVLLCCRLGEAFNGPAVYQLTEPLEHGEEPTWDPRTNALYFVDIHVGNIHSYFYDSDEHYVAHLNGEVTPIIPSKSNESLFVVGVNRTLVAVGWDGRNNLGKEQALTEISKQFPDSRFNDGKADKEGRLWIGTMGGSNAAGETKENEGVVYKITKDNLANPAVVIAPVTISNGLAWNKANDKFYYIDSPTYQVLEYQYDDEKGEISNPRVAINVTGLPNVVGQPDGMTIDTDDNLWIALYGGGSVIKVDPRSGELLQVVPIPARDVTSTMWGGPNLDILYVTTSKVSLTEEELKEYPGAGSLYAVTNLGAQGYAVFNADLD
ncbi:regucalcin-like [Cylas formicarius]|uniref:regucalcin-like n=1 Tax=Cylas formicarius TaxID=197179 RepID=UPI0029586A6F|nr:regucalcin-like [Cylas formicarius]